MTPPTDSLVAALRAVPSVHECHRDDPDQCCYDTVSASALAAAARAWIKKQMPPMRGCLPGEEHGARHYVYNTALADVARRLGL